jgi:hypothetical protein
MIKTFSKIKRLGNSSILLLLLSLTLNPIVGTGKETQNLQEDTQQIMDFIFEKGPMMISENKPEEVLKIIKGLPYKKRLDANIQVLEGFCHLKRWVLYKDLKSYEEWYGIRTNLIYTKVKEATPMLILLLKDNEPWLRLYAAELLGFIGDDRALKELEKVGKEDKNQRVRRYANWAYEQILSRRSSGK